MMYFWVNPKGVMLSCVGYLFSSGIMDWIIHGYDSYFQGILTCTKYLIKVEYSTYQWIMIYGNLSAEVCTWFHTFMWIKSISMLPLNSPFILSYLFHSVWKCSANISHVHVCCLCFTQIKKKGIIVGTTSLEIHDSKDSKHIQAPSKGMYIFEWLFNCFKCLDVFILWRGIVRIRGGKMRVVGNLFEKPLQGQQFDWWL